jgi:hypothetical protein
MWFRELAKRAIFSLDIGGIGEDCATFGLALTMGSIVVVLLQLSGVGTRKADITTQRTKRVPLFDKDTRKKLFGKNKAKNVEALFEIDNTKVPQDMPEGFCLLAQTLISVHEHGLGTSRSQMTRSKGSHGKFSMEPHTAEFIELGNYLGSGSFSHVLKLVDKDNDNVFIKIPLDHYVRRGLDSEAEVLKDLCENDCIPKLYDADHPIKTLRIEIRCESSVVPCLPLRGLIGRPAKLQRHWDSEKLESLVLQVYGALEYANSKGWAHLDVKPSNIVTHVDPDSGRFESDVG